MYVLPENSFQRRKHHEEMIRRIISNPESRNAANTYLYRQNHEEKERIVGILNQWDNESYSTTPSSQVINKAAVSNIKDWCAGSSGKDLVTVKKFLQHLTSEQEKETARDFSDESPRKGTAQGRRNSLNLSSNRPILKKRETITNGSFYPSPFEGRGNSTGMFNIVRSVPQPNLAEKTGKRPTTSGSVAPGSRKPSGIQRNATQPAMNRRQESFEIPTNRSGVFGEVIQDNVNQQNPPPQSKANRPYSNASYRSQASPQKENRPPNNRPTSQWSRPGTMQSGRSYSSKIPIGQSMQRSKTQGNMMRKRDSNEKLKFSANLHNAREDEISSSPPPPPPQQQQQQYQQQHQQQPEQQQHQQQPEPMQHQQPPRTAPYNNDGLTPRYQHNHGGHPQQQMAQYGNYEIDVSRNSPPPSRNQPAYENNNDGESSHRPIMHPNKFPGRRYQPSQIFN